ncbi:MAG: hypothetical protein R2854_25660 [Caldilineaceae bacterium]
MRLHQHAPSLRRLLILTLMFIGTAPASMGGGIFTGTFAVLVLAISRVTVWAIATCAWASARSRKP